MHTKIAKFLLPPLLLLLLSTLYYLIEPYILQLLSISKDNNKSIYILRILLLLPTVVAVASIAWVSDLQRKIKNLQSENTKLKKELTPDIAQRLLNAQKIQSELEQAQQKPLPFHGDDVA